MFTSRPWLAATLVLACAFAPRASADPRWWWDDYRLTNTQAASITPHIIAPGYTGGGVGGTNVFIVWAEVDAAGGGDTEIWLIASFDQGCTFCAPIRITDNDVDDRRPRIAVVALPTGIWSIAIAFESADQAVIAWDSRTASFRVPSNQLCGELADVGPAIITNAQYKRFGGGASPADDPDVCQSSTPAWAHFHATWRERTALAGSQIWYAHDLSAEGDPGWSAEPPKALLPSDPLSNDVEAPAIACDIATDPDPITGLSTNNRSAPNVVFVELNAGDETDVVGLRSVDSGATFSPDGVRADAPAESLSDPAAGGIAVIWRPAIDIAGSPFSTVAPVWVLTAFEDESFGPASMKCDARRLENAVVPNPGWHFPDEHVSQMTSIGDGRPSVAVTNAFGGPPPAWIAWQDSRFGAREIVYHAGMLDPLVPDSIDMLHFPFAPVRALDPSVSANYQLSHCVFDEATFACPPARTVGDAVDVSVDSNEFVTYAVWSDSRDGNREIYFKRTDRQLSMSASRLTTGCGPFGDAWIDVAFDLVAPCGGGFGAERMGRYLIYYGTSVGGPFDNAASPIVVEHALAGGSPVTRRISGLVPGTSYQVIVVAEDQARNVYPQSFDPNADLAADNPNERAITTPVPCAAVPICLWRSDVTSLLPHLPARAATYLVPPTPEDIALQGPAYRCPFATGEVEPDGNALFNRVPLVLYQVNRPISTLRLAKSASTIAFTF